MQQESFKIIKQTVQQHREAIEALDEDSFGRIAEAAALLTESLSAGNRVYICGNGGSAADAQHIAAELVGRFERERKGLPVCALTTDTSALTSISNDYGYENVFARQADAFVKAGDIFWGISTSGTSTSVINAAKTARQKGAKILAFTGQKGSKLEQMADVCFCSGVERTATSQEIHQLAYHIICDLVEENFA